MKRFALALFGLGLLAGCATTGDASGPISRNTLLDQYAPFADNYRRAPIDRSISDTLATLGGEPVTIKLYFGTWCSDSIAGVPVVLRLLDNVPKLSLEMVAVQRGMIDPAGAAKAAGISRIPTVIVERGGREIGRIVETPKVSWRDDLQGLLDAARTP